MCRSRIPTLVVFLSLPSFVNNMLQPGAVHAGTYPRAKTFRQTARDVNSLVVARSHQERLGGAAPYRVNV